MFVLPILLIRTVYTDVASAVPIVNWFWSFGDIGVDLRSFGVTGNIHDRSELARTPIGLVDADFFA